MKFRMFNRQSLLWLAAISLVAVAAVTLSRWDYYAVARDQEGYTLASIQGTYAFHIGAGANLTSAVVVSTWDGKGNWSGSGINNTLSADGTERVITPFSFVGTYTVNADGTGTTTVTITFQDGREVQFNEDFVITKAEGVRHGVRLATEVFRMRREPAVIMGVAYLVTAVQTRLPD